MLFFDNRTSSHPLVLGSQHQGRKVLLRQTEVGDPGVLFVGTLDLTHQQNPKRVAKRGRGEKWKLKVKVVEIVHETRLNPQKQMRLSLPWLQMDFY